MTDSGGGRPFLRTATFGVGVAHRRVVERTEGLRPVGGGRLVAGVVGVAFLVRGKDRDAVIEALGILATSGGSSALSEIPAPTWPW